MRRRALTSYDEVGAAWARGRSARQAEAPAQQQNRVDIKDGESLTRNQPEPTSARAVRRMETSSLTSISLSIR